MNYILEINAFYDWLETNPLSGNAINLWHALMTTANKAGWINKFAVAVSILEAKSGLNKKAVERARNELAQKGRIIWKSRNGNKSAEYTLISLCDKKGVQSVPQPVPQSVPQPVPQSVPQPVAINKLNKTKLNKNYLPKSPVGDDPVLPSQIIDDFNRICIGLNPVKIITEKRRSAINARMREHGYDQVIQMLENSSKSKFLSGQNKRGWTADFDWLFLPTNFVKVLEGKYNEKSTQPTPQNIKSKPNPFEALAGSYERIMEKMENGPITN